MGKLLGGLAFRVTPEVLCNMSVWGEILET